MCTYNCTVYTTRTQCVYLQFRFTTTAGNRKSFTIFFLFFSLLLRTFCCYLFFLRAPFQGRNFGTLAPTQRTCCSGALITHRDKCPSPIDFAIAIIIAGVRVRRGMKIRNKKKSMKRKLPKFQAAQNGSVAWIIVKLYAKSIVFFFLIYASRGSKK